MGNTTPNIGIYIPTAGETNYDQSFASGMVNIDQHDHSGAPNKGVPISSSGLADFSVTYNKLNSNVVNPLTGIGVSSTLPNKLEILGLLEAIFNLAPASGFISKDGILANARTFQNSSTITWTNADGVGGDPSATVNIAGLSPVVVANGGTGLTALAPYDILCGGTAPTANVQQVSGQGNAAQVLTSNGASALPTWQDLPAPPTQNLLQTTLTMTAAQFTNLVAAPQLVLAAPGAGRVIIPYNAYGKVTYGGIDRFHAGSSVRFFYGVSLATELNMNFSTGSFDDAFSAYYICEAFEPTSAGIPIANMENQPVYLSVNSSNFTGGSGNTVTISFQYSIIQI